MPPCRFRRKRAGGSRAGPGMLALSVSWMKGRQGQGRAQGHWLPDLPSSESLRRSILLALETNKSQPLTY